MRCCCSGERLNDFVVGLTDVSPSNTAPTWLNYAICDQYPGTVPEEATVILNCTAELSAYRYLIVQFHTSGYKQICELEVYIRRKFLCKRRIVQTPSLQYIVSAGFLPCDALRCTVFVIVILSVRLSVCPSVHLSVTLVDCVHTV